jgi:predicted AlkP superfamily phosphohydrolase/phosphomutase
MLHQKLDADSTFILMSDHGFCAVKKEVNLAWHLIQRGWLNFQQNLPKSLQNIGPSSRAYTLVPGRIYLNMKGREPRGSVEASDYERVREEVAESILELRDPDTGEKIIRQVVRREEIYRGQHLPRAADLIAIPFDGYDLKADVKKENFSEKTALVGMHTYDDAFLFVRGQGSIREGVEIVDLLPTVLAMMDIPIPQDVDGQVAL